MKRTSILVLVSVLSLSSFNAKMLPSFIQKCKRADPVPELSKCITDRANFLKPYLLKGIPDLNLPPIEPLAIPKIEIHTTNTTAFRFDTSFTDIQVFGIRDFQVKELNFDLEKKQIYLHFYIPILHIQGIYTTHAKVLLLEIASSGKGYGNVTDVEAKVVTTVLLEHRKGKQYIDLQVNPAPYVNYANPRLHLENLFPNNKELTDQTNKVINDNFNAIAEEINPLIYHTVRKLVVGIIKPIFSEYSLDELFD